MLHLNDVKNAFDDRLKIWYDNALIDYGVVGEGQCNISLDEIFPCGTQTYKIIVVYTENGETIKCFYQFCEEWRGEKLLINYLFDIWAEEGFTEF